MISESEAIIELERMDWHFAKSMANIPHWYARRREFNQNFIMFCHVASFIKNNGQPEKFHSKIYNYFYHGGFKYWIMADDPRDSEIINRANHD